MIDIDKLKAAALAAGGHDWQWWTSNSFRRLTFNQGRDTRDGSALSAVVQQSDGHPDVLMAAGVQEFIELASPAGVLALVEDRDRLRAALEELVNEQQPLGIDRAIYQQALFALAAQGQS